MKAIERKLYQRGTAYYYRSSLPLLLHHVLPFKEIVCSLGKIELTEARLKRAQLEYQENQIISAFWKDADAESGLLSSSTTLTIIKTTVQQIITGDFLHSVQIDSLF